jgi:mono/diheme cytochrome c family protein
MRGFCAFVLAGAVLVGAVSAQVHPSSALQKAPESFRLMSNPYTGDPEAALAGAKLFRRNCASCHGADAGGTPEGPGLRSPAMRSASPGAVFWVLRNGVLQRGMPSWSHLTEQRRWQIIAWLKSVQR